MLKRSRQGQLPSINAKVARNINRAIVLNLIRERQPVSRSSISGLTGLNKSTVSHIVTNLLEEDLIVEELDLNREIGRTPYRLRVRTGKHFVGAIHFDSIRSQIAIVDIDGAIRNRLEVDTERGNPDGTVRRCVGELESLRTRLSLPEFRGVGTTVSGIVDSHRARVILSPALGWRDFDLGSSVRNLLPTVQTIQAESDARAAALAELLFGDHVAGIRNLVFLSVGFGIGAGIVLDSRILSGASHAAGDFGHLTMVEDGEQCSCGNRGCWELYASDRATVSRYAAARQLTGDQSSQVTMQDVVSAARSGDAVARQELQRAGRYIGRGIANIILTFDPEMIIVGGIAAQAWDTVYPEIADAVKSRGFFGKEPATAIVPTSLSENPPLVGAAALSIWRIFTDHGNGA